MKACNKHMMATFADEVKAMKVACPGESFSIDIVNLIRLCEKYFCRKVHDAKGDQVDFHTWVRDSFLEFVVSRLERACSGARMDLATNGSLPIFRNLPKKCLFLHRQVENNDKNENGFVRVLHKLLHSVQMTAYLCLMTIYDVAICQPHRFLAGSAHVLHTSMATVVAMSGMDRRQCVMLLMQFILH